MARLKALLWDVDGTLAETERDGHRVAFNRAFAAHLLPWRWDVACYGELLAVTGGRERILHYLASRGLGPAGPDARDALARELHAAKNRHYAALMRAGGLPLRAGVRELLQASRASGLRQAIVTTTSRANVDILLRTHLGADWHVGFATIVCGEDVQRKKPDPEAYLRALAGLGLDPADALAIEDSPAGAAAATAARVPVIVTRSAYFAHASFDAVLAIGPGLHARRDWSPPAPARARAPARAPVALADLAHWHALAGRPDAPAGPPLRPRRASAASSRPSSSPPIPRRSTRG
ncbi:MAG: HAD-IA family hydrolase [Lautropia sp.]